MDSRADGSAGATKRRILLRFYAVRFPNPTRAFSARQLPADHDHAVPTREYQSDQSSRMLLGCRRPCCPKQNPLKAHQRERVPAPPPVDVSVDARTVLAVKGSLRRAKNGRALDCSAPFRPDRHRDGRLRREHFALCCTRTKTPAPCGSRLDSKKICQALTGLDRVAPYQNRDQFLGRDVSSGELYHQPLPMRLALPSRQARKRLRTIFNENLREGGGLITL